MPEIPIATHNDIAPEGANELWQRMTRGAGRELAPRQQALLGVYLDLLLAANETMNLTGIADRGRAEILHVADALTLLPFLPPGPHRLADVGSGGGVPGIPLAIARPDVSVLLIESTQKKAAFLRNAAEKLSLENVSISAERAENIARSNARESFDVVVARAVGRLEILAEWSLPLAKIGGKVLAMKGPKVAEELPAARKIIRLLGGASPALHPVDLPTTSGHLIVEISKQHRTSPRFPRPSIPKG